MNALITSAPAGGSAKGVVGSEGRLSSSATSSEECGSDWNRHIRYIMIDFLSGLGVFTSEMYIFSNINLY